jgi:hypothetical protein
MRALIQVFAAAVLAACLPSVATAQRGFSLGANAGLSVARVSGADAERVDWRNRFTGGVFASVGVSDRLAFEVDAAYAAKGATMTGSFNGTLTYRFDYVEVPVLIRCTLLPTAHVTPVLVVGLAPAFRLNSTSTNWVGTLPVPQQFIFPKSTDFGLVFGAALELPRGRHRIRVDARYTLGRTRLAALQFTDLTGGRVENPDVDLKNGALTLTVGYAIRVAPSRIAGARSPRAPRVARPSARGRARSMTRTG